MRVQDYLTIVIVVCVLGAFSLESFLIGQSDAERQQLIATSKSQRLASEFVYIRSNVAQYLLTGDLVIGSGETYLIPGGRDQAAALVEQLSAFEDQVDSAATAAELARLRDAVAASLALIDRAGEIDDLDRDSKLAALLDDFDPLYTTADELGEKIGNDLATAAADSAGQLEASHSSMITSRIAALAVFVIVVLGVWRWASRQISKPIKQLAAMANESTAKAQFAGVDEGPREIRILSDRFKTLTERLVHQATHDSLTNLVNRRELERLLHEWMDTADAEVASSEIGVICYIDLDRFKLVNDTCGHSAGDDLLNQVAEIFRGTTRFGDIIARLGGDEFCLVLKNCGLDKGLDIAELVRERIEDLRFDFKGQTFRISASIGVAKIASGAQSSESIIDQADSACAVAKESGRNRIYVFDLLDQKVDQKRLDTVWINELTLALEEQRLVLYRQPIVALFPEEPRGQHFEVLVRMRGNDGKIIPPSRFMPVAERYHLCTNIDEWVLQATLDWLSRDRQQAAVTTCCSINVSGDSLSRPEFLETASNAIRQSGVDAGKLCFEITETQAIADLPAAQRFVTRMRSLGCQFALDDFGVGHTSFAQLRDLPVDYVKIDGSFVRNITSNARDRATVHSLLEICRAHNKRTVAEYVESEEIFAEVQRLGIDFAQGFHCGTPMPIEQVDELDFSTVISLSATFDTTDARRAAGS